VVIIPGDQPEEGIDGYGGKDYEKKSSFMYTPVSAGPPGDTGCCWMCVGRRPTHTQCQINL